MCRSAFGCGRTCSSSINWTASWSSWLPVGRTRPPPMHIGGGERDVRGADGGSASGGACSVLMVSVSGGAYRPPFPFLQMHRHRASRSRAVVAWECSAARLIFSPAPGDSLPEALARRGSAAARERQPARAALTRSAAKGIVMIHLPRHWTPGRLHFVFGFDRMLEWRSLGWRRFHFGLFWLRKLPPEGERFTRAVYRGFWLIIKFWLPFEIER